MKGRLGPREEILLSAGLVLLAVAAWYLALYQPIAVRTGRLNADIEGLQDSLNAINRYKAEVASYSLRSKELEKQIKAWDARFPSRSQIVNLTKQFIAFAENRGLNLIEVQPSLFELYALERAGAQVSGRYVMQLPLKFRFAGRYMDLGRMLEALETLPFNVSLSELKLEPLAGKYPLLNCEVNLFLYVHL